MSDFLARLVQRTRGEAAVVRPVGPAVTAPDLGAPAWDEQVLEREAPLASAPRGPAARRAMTPANAETAVAVRTVVVPERARTVAASPMPTPVTSTTPTTLTSVEPERASAPPLEPRASLLDPRPDQPAAAETAAEAQPSSFRAVAQVAQVELRELQLPMIAAPTLAPARQPVAVLARPAAARAPREGENHAAADVGVDVGVGRVAPALSPPPPVESTMAVADAATTPAARATAAELPARAADAAGRPSLARVASRPQVEPRSPGPAAFRAEADAVHEHSTTVEVSIGRIEVRLPPQARPAAAAEPMAPPRRATVSLADYLQGRDSGTKR